MDMSSWQNRSCGYEQFGSSHICSVHYAVRNLLNKSSTKGLLGEMTQH